jgi:eukaryotic-like serine/threonine-protein kinase
MKLPLRPEVEEAFAAALELPEVEQLSYLERAYAHDPQLRAEVLSLLAIDQVAKDFLEPHSGGAARWTGAADSQPVPSRIGRYRILRRVGEGGMGVVYEAEQDQPRRTVALKVIKAALAGPELLHRFERESQVLGRLQHPGIAQVYEAGTADTGFGPQPYFAMEFIAGVGLLEYVAAQRLNTRRRLELMIQICEAVNHAHQRGIIHRDLKPGNILVDAAGQPKVLDFGVARLADKDEPGAHWTNSGELVGTLAYMSPEQALADPLEIDTRSDVYSLGIILFELLAGRLPYQIGRQLPETVRTIREAEPASLGSVSRAYRGDIETIASRALEKERGRRYSSAAELAADLRCYLKDEPIMARRPSTVYRARKFVRRHKALVVGTASVFAVLVAGIIESTAETERTRRAGQAALRERDRATAAEQAANRQRDLALAAEYAATAQRNRAVLAEN